MPKNKNVQGEVNGDGFGSGNSVGRGSGPSGNANSSTIRTSSVSNSGYNNTGANHQNKGSPEAQLNLNLGPLTQATREAVQHMLETHKAFNHLSDMYTKHASDIEEVPKIRQRFTELEKQGKDKDEKIRKLQDTIETLEERRQDKEAAFTQEKRVNKKERDRLEADREELRKLKETTEEKIKIQDAERRREKERELEKLKREQENELRIRKDELEREMKKQEEEIKLTLATVEARRDKLSKELIEKKDQNKDQEIKLKEAVKHYDIVDRAMNSYKDETDRLKVRLEMIESEFALNNRTPEF
jgi:chromosome segregation ATPase